MIETREVTAQCKCLRFVAIDEDGLPQSPRGAWALVITVPLANMAPLCLSAIIQFQFEKTASKLCDQFRYLPPEYSVIKTMVLWRMVNSCKLKYS